MNYDVLIKNGFVLDGAGNPWFHADLGIVGEQIATIGKLKENAKTIIDAKDLFVSPGFIDMHSHSDYSLLIDNKVESMIRQGVTTEVVGLCGGSAAPMNKEVRSYRDVYMRKDVGNDFKFDWVTMGDYINKIENNGISFNVVPLVGHGTIRQNVMGFENRNPTKNELLEMKKLVDEAMKDGAFGISTGLSYTPAYYAKTEEIIELTKVVSKYNGIYVSHVRSEADDVIKSVKEAIEIGEKANVPIEISHLKASGEENWGKTVQLLKIIEDTRRRGVDITFDQYPYIATSTNLAAFLPDWANEGGLEKLLQRLKSPEIRNKIKNSPPGPATPTKNWDRVSIVFSKKHPNYEGKTISDVAKIEGKEVMDTVFDIIIEEEGQIGVVAFSLSEDDVKRVMSSPYGMVGSDGSAVAPVGILGKGKPHPRYYGTFPRVLGHYARDEGVLVLQEAVRKMTSASTQRLHLEDRGLLKKGFKADVVVFNFERIKDEATFTNPHKFPSGIPYVLVNGTIVINNYQHTGALPGKVLKRV